MMTEVPSSGAASPFARPGGTALEMGRGASVLRVFMAVRWANHARGWHEDISVKRGSDSC